MPEEQPQDEQMSETEQQPEEERAPATRSVKATREDTLGLMIPGLKVTMAQFLEQQRDRLADEITAAYGPLSKAARKDAPPTWWDQQREDDYLRAALRSFYVDISRAALGNVANTLGRIVYPPNVRPILDRVLAEAGKTITKINDNTREKVEAALSEGVRRGYSLNQLIDGVANEGYAGLRNLPEFTETRLELDVTNFFLL